MKVILQVSGREMTFSEKELVDILEKHFANEEEKQTKTAQKPTEGKWFEVNPLNINQQLFKRQRGNPKQETMRKLILEAFEEMKNNPKYTAPFKTMIPEKTWERKSVDAAEKLAIQLGDHIADWVEQALEWAQRIANGEKWKTICNEADTTKWYRLIVGKDGYKILVGGSKLMNTTYPASDMLGKVYTVNSQYHAVPLVVSYE